MAVTLETLVVKLAGDTGGFRAAMLHASASLRGLVEVSGELGQNLRSLGLIAGGIGGAITGFFALAVRQAAAMELQVAKMNAALSATGVVSEKTTKDLVQLARATADLTGNTQEAVIASESYLLTMGLTATQVQKVITPLAQLATIQGRDLQTASFLFARGITGSTFALRRLLPELAGAKKGSLDFDDILKALNKRTADFGGVAGTFTVQLARVRSALSNLMETIGQTFLPALTKVADVMVRLINSMEFLAGTRGGKIAIWAIAAAGAILTFVAAIAGFLAVVPIFLGALKLAGAGLSLVVLGLGHMIPAATAAGAAGVVAFAPLILTIGALVAATVLLLAKMQNISDVLLATEAATRVWFKTLSAKAYREEFDRVIKSIIEGRQEMDKTSVAVKGLTESLEDSEKRFKTAALGISAAAAELRAGLAKRTRLELSVTGLQEGDLRRILENEARDRNAIDRQELANRISINRERISRLISEEADKNEEIARLRAQDETGNAQAIERAEKDLEGLVEKRLQNEKEASEGTTRIRELEKEEFTKISQEIAQRAKALKDQRLAELKNQLDRETALRKAATDLQLEYLRRAVQKETELAQFAVDARSQIAKHGLSIERQDLQQRIRARNALVAQGLADQLEMDKKNRAEEVELQERELQQEIDNQNRILALAEQVKNREIQAAIAAGEIKKQQIRDELKLNLDKAKLDEDFRVAELVGEKKLAEVKLDIATATAQAETRLKIKSLLAQAKAGLAAAKTPEEKAAFKASIAELDGFLADSEKFGEEVNRKRLENNVLIDQQITNIRTSGAKQRVHLERVAGLQIQGVDSETAENVIAANQKADQAQLAGLSGLTEQRARILQLRNAREDQLREEGVLSEGQIQDALKPYDFLLDKTDRVIRDLNTGIKGTLSGVKDQLTEVGSQLDRVFDPLKVKIEAIAEPLKQIAGLFPGFGATIGGAVNQTIHNTFSANGVTIKMSADEARLLERLFAMLLGPEGNKEFEKFQSRTQGKNPGAAGSLTGGLS